MWAWGYMSKHHTGYSKYTERVQYSPDLEILNRGLCFGRETVVWRRVGADKEGD